MAWSGDGCRPQASNRPGSGDRMCSVTPVRLKCCGRRSRKRLSATCSGIDPPNPPILISNWQQMISEPWHRSEEHTSELQSLMRISYAVFCLKKKKIHTIQEQILK